MRQTNIIFSIVSVLILSSALGAQLRQQAYVKASNTDADDNFGHVLAVSGDTMVVGACREASKATGVNGDQSDNSASSAGAAYVYVRSAGVWTQQAYLKASNSETGDGFGDSVAISGDTIVVGASGEDSNARSVNGNAGDNSASFAGAAYVFVRSAGAWSQQAYLKASNADGGDLFGFTVAVSGETVVVGALGESSNAMGVNGNAGDNSAPASGAAYVFVRNGTSWSEQAYLKASNTNADDIFGACVTVAGDSVVVGADQEASRASGVNGNELDNSAFHAGAAYVFARSGGTWIQEAYLKASNAEAGDQFGFAVATSGDSVVISSRSEASSATGINGNQGDNTAPSAGAAYVFVRSGGSWVQEAYLKASNAETGDEFGYDVSMSGDKIVVGARYEDSNATGVNGNESDNTAIHAGAAYAYVRSAGLWSQQAYLKSSNVDIGDYFGLSVSVSGDLVSVGAYGEDSKASGVNGQESDNSLNAAGAAYVLDRCAASSDQIGTGCIASGPPPTLAVTPPIQGKSVVLTIGSPLPNTGGVVLLGLQHPGIPLSLHCVAYFDLRLPTVPIFFSTNASGAWVSPPVTVGSFPSLNCVRMGLQAGLSNAATAPFGLALSNGVWVTIGN